MLYVTQVPIYGLYKYLDLDNLKQVYRGRCQREGLITWLRNFLLEVENWKFTAWRFNWGPLTPLARPGETRVAGPIRKQTCSFDQDEVKITMKMMKFRIQDHDLGVFDYGLLYMCTRPMQKKTVKCEPWTQFLLSVTYLIAIFSWAFFLVRLLNWIPVLRNITLRKGRLLILTMSMHICMLFHCFLSYLVTV